MPYRVARASELAPSQVRRLRLSLPMKRDPLLSHALIGSTVRGVLVLDNLCEILLLDNGDALVFEYDQTGNDPPFAYWRRWKQ